MPDIPEIPDFLYKLAEGCSTYFKVSIKFWISLAIISIIIVISVGSDSEKIKMPFELGELSKIDFYPLSFVILSILIISFGASFTQGIRAHKLVQKSIDQLGDNKAFYNVIYFRDIMDMLIYPSINRVAPLAQSLQGKNQFFPESDDVPRYLKIIYTMYYSILKLVSLIVMYLFPAYALIVSFLNGNLYKLNSIWNIPIAFFG